MGWTRINEFVVSEGCEERLVALLTEVTEYLLDQEGCQGVELLISDEDDTKFVIVERWASKEAHHQALVRFPKEKMAAARNWFARPPRGEFFTDPGVQRRAVH